MNDLFAIGLPHSLPQGPQMTLPSSFSCPVTRKLHSSLRRPVAGSKPSNNVIQLLIWSPPSPRYVLLDNQQIALRLGPPRSERVAHKFAIGVEGPPSDPAKPGQEPLARVAWVKSARTVGLNTHTRLIGPSNMQPLTAIRGGWRPSLLGRNLGNLTPTRYLRSFGSAVPNHSFELHEPDFVRGFMPSPEAFRQIQTPALAVYMGQVRHNIQSVLRLCGDDPSRWRPHVKTTKLPAVWKELYRAGVRRFKCATTRELELLVQTLQICIMEQSHSEQVDAAAAVSEVVDVLLAYPVRPGPVLDRVGQLSAASRRAQVFSRFRQSDMDDAAESSPAPKRSLLSEEGQKEAGDYSPSLGGGPEIRISVLLEHEADAVKLPPRVGWFLDLNPGMDRTGIPVRDYPTIRNAWARQAELDVDNQTSSASGAAPGPAGWFMGLHFYDGHHRQACIRERRQAAERGYQQLLEVAERLSQETRIPELVTSGTPTFWAALQHPELQNEYLRGRGIADSHSVSPGTVVFHDWRSQKENHHLDFRPAALVLGRVVSHPGPDICTTDLGSKSVAAEVSGEVGVVLGHPGLRPLDPSEEHLPFRLEPGSAGLPARGSPVLFWPTHICPSVNLAEQALLVHGDGQPPQVVDVAARAHDLLLPGAELPRGW